MENFKAKIRVRYADTDQMGFVYNGKYFEYFEVARTEFLRARGLAYNDLEKAGYMLPVVEANVKYKKPIYYDDVIEIETFVKNEELPAVHIEYLIRREGEDTILAEGFTRHVFISSETKRPVRPPKIYLDTVKTSDGK